MGLEPGDTEYSEEYDRTLDDFRGMGSWHLPAVSEDGSLEYEYHCLGCVLDDYTHGRASNENNQFDEGRSAHYERHVIARSKQRFLRHIEKWVPAREVRKGIEDGIIKPNPKRYKVQRRHEQMVDPLVDGEEMSKDLLGPLPDLSSDEGARRDRGIGLQRPRPFVPGSDSD